MCVLDMLIHVQYLLHTLLLYVVVLLRAFLLFSCYKKLHPSYIEHGLSSSLTTFLRNVMTEKAALFTPKASVVYQNVQTKKRKDCGENGVLLSIFMTVLLGSSSREMRIKSCSSRTNICNYFSPSVRLTSCQGLSHFIQQENSLLCVYIPTLNYILEFLQLQQLYYYKS